MAKDNRIPEDQNILNVPLEEAMPDNFLPYAVEVAKTELCRTLGMA